MPLPIEDQGINQPDSLGEVEADQDQFIPQDEAEHHDALPEAEAETEDGNDNHRKCTISCPAQKTLFLLLGVFHSLRQPRSQR